MVAAAHLSFLQFSPQTLQSKDPRRKFNSPVNLKFNGSSVVSCSYPNNGSEEPKNDAVRDVERLLEASGQALGPNRLR